MLLITRGRGEWRASRQGPNNMSRSPEERLADIAKREAALRRAKARARKDAADMKDQELRSAGWLLKQTGPLNWNRDRLRKALIQLSKQSGES
jgi:hypothetical protein